MPIDPTDLLANAIQIENLIPVPDATLFGSDRLVVSVKQ